MALTGSENSRFGICAHRAAPVQISCLGYPESMGAFDHSVADKNLTKQSGGYSETPLSSARQRAIGNGADADRTWGPENGFVFCALSNSYKITPAEFDLWMRLLQTVEGSVLWLLQDNVLLLKNLMIEAAKRGVDPKHWCLPSVRIMANILRGFSGRSISGVHLQR